MTEAVALLPLTTRIVVSYLGNNPARADDLPSLIAGVHAALAGLNAPKPEPLAELTPAVPINKSFTRDYIISLETGEKLKMLRRHLRLRGMTPAEYRAKWGLPHDYPMVAPGYSERRSELAVAIGLGRKAA